MHTASISYARPVLTFCTALPEENLWPFSYGIGARVYVNAWGDSEVLCSPKPNTRNRVPGTNCTENAVSCLGFRGVWPTRLLAAVRYWHSVWGPPLDRGLTVLHYCGVHDRASSHCYVLWFSDVCATERVLTVGIVPTTQSEHSLSSLHLPHRER
eukprot:1290256-Rhodomonas_salina.1